MHPRLYIIILWHQCVLTLFIYLASHTWGQETISSVSIHDNNIDSHYTTMYFYNWQNKVNWKSSCRITFYDQCHTEVEVKVWSATEQVVSEQVCLLSRSNFSNLKNKRWCILPLMINVTRKPRSKFHMSLNTSYRITF